MDETTRKLISILFRRQNEIAERQIGIFKQSIQERDLNAKGFRLICALMKMFTAGHSQEEIREQIDQVGEIIDQLADQDEQKRLIARCESGADQLSATIQSLLDDLESDDSDPFPDADA